MPTSVHLREQILKLQKANANKQINTNFKIQKLQMANIKPA
jgi:hypothetical protein